jgi:excinuclease UvrABC nuclease subunit
MGIHMPFNSNGEFAFTEHMIKMVAPTSAGVYGIHNGRIWVYVGEAQNIEERLLSHVRGESDQSVCIFTNAPTQFLWELVPGGQLSRRVRESTLIEELRPACNRT